MADLGAVWVQVRAHWVLARTHARNARDHARKSRHAIVSALLIVLGLGGALGGGALVGEWCLGVVLIGESAGLVWFGLFRDDSAPAPRPAVDVFERARRLP